MSVAGFLDVDAILETALDHHQAGRLTEAEAIYREILALNGDHADSLHLLGLLRYQTGHKRESVATISRAIALNPENGAYYNNLGNSLRDLGQLQAASDAFKQALRRRPQSPEIHSNLGNVLRDLGFTAEALNCYRSAVSFAPDQPHLYYNLANLLAELGDLAGAVNGHLMALELDPEFSNAHYNLGNAYLALNRLSEAEVSFVTTIRLRPGDVGAYNNLGIVFREQGWMDMAERSFRTALALDPSYAEAHYNLGCILLGHSDVDAAAECYRRAVELRADYGAARIALCMAQLPVIYRDETEIALRRGAYEARLKNLVEDTSQSATVMAEEIGTSQPFFLAYQGYNDRQLQRLYGEWACRIMAKAFPATAACPGSPDDGQKIRLGIVSGFYHDHTVWKLFLNGWLKEIDRSRFEVFGYYTGVRQDNETATANKLCDRFVHGTMPKAQWRSTIQGDAPHILLYPDIGMDPISAYLAAQRLARVQCSTWGHPETSGFPTIDYFLSNGLMEPLEAEDHYTERLVLLPNLSTYYVPDEAPALVTSRVSLGYRPSATVFWSGQAIYKYLPQYDDLYARIAQQVEDSQFVFIDFAKSRKVSVLFRERLHACFERFGLDAKRHCLFLPPLDQRSFLAALGQSDVVLDTVGWSGGRSTLDSLVHDPAIVTHAGPMMRGRHTAAILRRIGITETIAETVDQYVEIAVRLAKDKAWRGSIRERVRTGKFAAYRDRDYIRGLEAFLIDAVGSATHAA